MYNTFTWASDDDMQKIDMILKKFENYCKQHPDVTGERHMLGIYNQHDDETIGQYVTDLKRKAQTCEFQKLKDGLIFERIVCGILYVITCSRLLKEPI